MVTPRGRQWQVVRAETPGVSRRRHPLAVAAVWGILVGLASVTPPSLLGVAGPGGPSLFAPFLHLVGYAVLAALLVRADTSIVGAVLLATVVGLLVEGLQAPLAFRDASLLDALVNLTGALLGAWTAGSATRAGNRVTHDRGD